MISPSLLKRAREAVADRQASLRRESLAVGRPNPRDPKYRDDPGLYARDILGVTLTPEQDHILRLCMTPPYRVLVKSAHNVGKSFIAAVKISHQYDCYEHSATISLAPTKEHVVDVLWTELRLLRAAAPGGYLGGFTGPKAPMLFSGPDHWAKGMTNESGEAFAGRHRANMGFVFDEAIGVDDLFWRVAATMFRPMKGNFFLAIFNPTDPTSRAFLEEQAREGQSPNDRPKWHSVEISALDHPNVLARLKNPQMDDADLPVPQAVTAEQISGWVCDMTDKVIEGEDVDASDVEWPPGSGEYFRPAPDFECRALGRWPSGDTYGIWSDRLWSLACEPKPHEPDLRPNRLPVIGCDVAQRGFNLTTMHVRQNNTSLSHERHSGWDSVRTAGRLIELCNELALWLSSLRPSHAAPIDPKHIPVNVDGSGDFGVLAIGQHAGYNWRGVVAQSRAVLFDRYDSVRSELWFGTKTRAKQGWLDLSRLKREDLQRLRSQALAVQWTLQPNGCRKVESKDDIRKPNRMGSEFLIDDIDGMNLAYYEPCPQDPTAHAEKTEGVNPSVEKHAAYRRGMYGLKGQ
jgi:hypothetical protein